jgi:hypothetical protein
LDQSAFIQFEITSGPDEYLRLGEISFHLKVKAKCDIPTGKTVVAWDKIGPVNYLLHSMIKQVDVFIGDTQITSSPSTYPYRAYFEAFLGYGKDAKESHLTQSLWFCDENKKSVDDVIAKGSKYTKDSKEIQLMGKLHLDISYQDRLLIGGSKLIIRILPNEPEFYFLAKETQKPTMEYLDAFLRVKRARVTPLFVDAQNSALQVAPAKYPITHVRVKASTVQSGQHEANLDNVHSGQLPRRIFVAFVKNKAYCGDYTNNPFYFENLKITQIAAFLDGQQYPAKAYTPDFENGLTIVEQNALFDSLNMLHTDSTINITRDNYGSGNTIFGFNFAPDLSNGCGGAGHVNQIRYGTLHLQIRFKEALTDVITALIYCEFDKIIEVDAARNAHIDFI